jgi:ParB family chromosome partitioning protein
LEIKVSEIKMNIKKGDMAARAALAAKSAPTIGDRLRHAQDLVHTHPADETPKPYLAASAPQAWVRRPLRLALPCRPSRPFAHRAHASRKSPIELIVLPYNARHIYRPERVSELAASIARTARRFRPGCHKQGGRHVLAAGHYRLRALKLIGAKPWT